MQTVAKSIGIDKLERTQLISGFEATDVLFSTSMLQWVINHGFRVYNVRKIIQFSLSRPFAKFADQIAKMRREADSSEDLLLSTSAKSLGNSSYGFTLYSVAKGVDTKLVSKENIDAF